MGTVAVPSDSVPGLNWMETQPLSIPSDADSLRGEIHVALTGFRVAGGTIPSNLAVFSADLIQTASIQNLKRLTLGQLAALGVEDISLAFKIAVPLHAYRGKALRLRTRLIGQDESLEPAWSVLLVMDSVEAGSPSGRSTLAKNEMGGQPTQADGICPAPQPSQPVQSQHHNPLRPAGGLARLARYHAEPCFPKAKHAELRACVQDTGFQL